MSRPRKHHFVPRFYLKGFTKDSSDDSALWVGDLENLKCWKSTPSKAARETDFYRGDLGPDIDPMWFERALGETVEPLLAQVLAFVLDTKDVPPCGLAYQAFLNLVATSLVRGPSMRTMTATSFDRSIKDKFRELAASEEGQILLQKMLKNTGWSIDQFLSLNDEESLQYNFDRLTHLKAMMDQVSTTLNAFSRRTWTVRAAADDVPDLVCSDVPVGMIPLAKEVPLLWFDPNVLVVMPLNRRIAAIGSAKDNQLPEALNTVHVARLNASTTRGATQVYCSEPAFVVWNRQQVQRVELFRNNEVEPSKRPFPGPG